MYPRSAKFDAAVINSHVVISKAEVYRGTALLYLLDLATDGNITVDDAPIRRRATLTLTDPEGDLTPAEASDLLAPFGNEIHLSRGIKFANGTKEYLPCGVLGISKSTVTDSGEGIHILVDLYDRARKVSRSRLVNDYVILTGTNFGTAIQDLISSRVPGLTFNFTSTVLTTPTLIFTSGMDVWEKARAMAASIGMDLFFDVEGTCVMKPVLNPLLAPISWSYKEGDEATILSVNKTMTDEETYNHVIVTGEELLGTTPVRGEAYDDDQTSPTYYLGEYGDIVYFQPSPFVTTTAQAVDAANGKLNKVLGTTEDVRFNSIVHPAHEIDDVVEIVRERSRVNAKYVLDKLTIPLTPDRAMEVSTRKRKY